MTVSSEIITAEFFRAMPDNMEQLKLAYASENRERILDLDNEFHEMVYKAAGKTCVAPSPIPGRWRKHRKPSTSSPATTHPTVRAY